jgi:hypothetical protein
MKRIIILLVLLSPFYLIAQNTLYFMDRMPESISLNPAFAPHHVKFFVSLGGTSLNIYNSGFNYNEIKNFTDNLTTPGYNPDEFVNSIGKYDELISEMKVNLLLTGIKLKDKGYLSFSVSTESSTELRAASKIAYLLSNFNDIESIKFPITVDGIDVRMTNYLSIGFAYSRKITKNFTLGISPHLNLNLMSLKSSNLSYTLNEVMEDAYSIKFKSTLAGKAQLGVPFDLNPNALNGEQLDLNQNIFPDHILNELNLSNLLKNKSFSLDVGGTFTVNKWTLSASILNFGSSSLHTKGYDITGDNNETLLAKKTDNLSIGIPTKILLGLSQQFSPKWNCGILLRNTTYNWITEKSATVSLNGSIGRMFSTSVSYTAGTKFNDLGLGIRMRSFFGDTYLLTDNITQLVNLKNTNRLTFSAGMNFDFGTK